MTCGYSSLYLIPSYKCNLHCVHCNIRDIVSVENHEAFISSVGLHAGGCDNVILFGGEPLLLGKERIEEIFKAAGAKPNSFSISTNLLGYEKSGIGGFVASNKIRIGTSWNPTRFDTFEFETWFETIRKVTMQGVSVTILITLTDDLFSSNVSRLLDMCDELDPSVFRGVKFEPYVPSAESEKVSHMRIQNADKWLVDITSHWKYKFSNIIADEYRSSGNFQFCSSVHTILPDGSVIQDCPMHYVKDSMLSCDKCIKCKYRDVCRPCRKQPCCSFFSGLYEYLKSER
jgi:MoaA/NifB/PqqE/SkfB family radical SAM enzyme